MYLSGMLKQKIYQKCCFTINQVLNKPNKENGCNSENFMAHLKCLRSKLVGNVYAAVIFMCWHVRNGVEPNAPSKFVWCMLSLYFIITKEILNALSWNFILEGLLIISNSGSCISAFTAINMERYDLRIVALILKHFRCVRKIAKSDYVMSVCPSTWLGFHWPDFHEIWFSGETSPLCW